MAWRSRIETLISSAIETADGAAIERLIHGRVREETDLDFKKTLYGSSDKEKRELAGDVAAMANAVGGVIVLGIREDNAVAVESTPVQLSDEEELRMRQIVASTVFPTPEWRIHRVSAGLADTGFYLLDVPPSPLAPHAVRVDDNLRYPKRDGTRKRWLSESEVADAYRNRFTMASSQVARIDQVLDEGRVGLVAVPDRAFVVLALVPTSHAEMRINTEQVQRYQRVQMLPIAANVPVIIATSTVRNYSPRPEAGYRRVVIYFSERTHWNGVLHLHSDGSGFVALPVGDTGTDPNNDVPSVNDELLTQEVLVGLSLLGSHAVESCHAVGDALVAGTLHGRQAMELTVSPDLHGNLLRHSQTTPQIPVGRYTMALDDLTGSATNLAIAAHTVLADLVQAFGVAEPRQIGPDGEFRVKHFGHDLNQQNLLRQGADRLGIVLSEEVVP